MEEELEKEIDISVGHLVDAIADRYNLRELHFHYHFFENGEGWASYSYDVRYKENGQ